MSYFLVNNFNLGIDRRRPIYSAFDGSVWDAVNCHLSRGGDLEKRKAFVQKYTLPSNTFGLADASDKLYTFGSDPSVSVPSGVVYQQLSHPDGVAMTELLSTTAYDGAPYVVAKFADGGVYHFNGGNIVTDFVNGIARPAIATKNAMAIHLAALINATATLYTAVATSDYVTITAVANNTPFTITAETINGGATDNQGITISLIQASTGVLPQISRATITGAVEVGDKYAIVLGGVAFGFKNTSPKVPTIVYTFGSKVYGLADSLLEFSGTGKAGEWDFDTAGAGFLNLATNDSGSAMLTGVEVYQGLLSVFSARNVQIYSVKATAAENALLQILKNTGTTSPKSVLAYGDIDVFYLSDSGIRSVRARAPSNAGFVNDIGTTVDDYVRDYRNTLTQEQVNAACATIEPLDGRYMLAIGNIIMVLSYFPSSQISGWTAYATPFIISDFATIGDKLYCRSGNTVYLYGGDDGQTYDNSTVSIQLPFLDGKRAGTGKQMKGIDVSSTGTWQCEVLVDPRDLTQKLRIGDIDGVTWGALDASAFAYVTHIAPNFTNTSSGFASISTVGIAYEAGDEQA